MRLNYSRMSNGTMASVLHVERRLMMRKVNNPDCEGIRVYTSSKQYVRMKLADKIVAIHKKSAPVFFLHQLARLKHIKKYKSA
jgi:hypothetical protein